jgi:diketogulonate reductase-like aldo/keto reductase
MKITDIQGTVSLHNGVEMPYLGLGVFETPDGQETIDAYIGLLRLDTGILILHTYT